MSTLNYNTAIASLATKTYTMQEAIDHSGFGWFQYKVILLTGLSMMCEAASVVTFSLLGPILQCHYQLTTLQQTAIPSTALIGTCVFSPLWGKMADLYGRKWVLTLATCLEAVFILLTALSPNLVWIYINMFLAGAVFGGIFQSLTLCSEYAPTKHRAWAILMIDGMFAVTVLVLTLMAKLSVPTLGWRWFLVLSLFPELIFACVAFRLPESARFLSVSGQHSRAQRLIETVCRTNGKPPPDGCLSAVDVTNQRLGSLSDLLSREQICISLPMIITWFAVGMCYFGMYVLTPAVFMEADGCHGSDIQRIESIYHCRLTCQGLGEGDFDSIAWTSGGELSAFPVAAVLLLFMGRKRTLTLLLVVFTAMSFTSMLCMSRAQLTVILFITRTSTGAMFAVIVIFSVEVYPTTYRSVAVGVNGAAYKLGSLLSPLLAQTVTSHSVLLGFLSFGLIGVLGLVAVCLIPIETKNKALK